MKKYLLALKYSFYVCFFVFFLSLVAKEGLDNLVGGNSDGICDRYNCVEWSETFFECSHEGLASNFPCTDDYCIQNTDFKCGCPISTDLIKMGECPYEYSPQNIYAIQYKRNGAPSECPNVIPYPYEYGDAVLCCNAPTNMTIVKCTVSTCTGEIIETGMYRYGGYACPLN